MTTAIPVYLNACRQTAVLETERLDLSGHRVRFLAATVLRKAELRPGEGHTVLP